MKPEDDSKKKKANPFVEYDINYFRRNNM